MNKAILLSIKPKHLINILNGKKTLELRKNVPKNYVGWVYMYVTKDKKDILYKYKDKYYTQHYLTFTDSVEVLNSKVVARFWFDECDIYNYEDVSFPEGYEDYDGTFVDTTKYVNGYYVLNRELENLCLSYEEFEEYGKGKDLYAWHINKLEIFDTPKELSEFYKFKKKWIYSGMDCPPYVDEVKTRLSKAPQSYQFVYEKEEQK